MFTFPYMFHTKLYAEMYYVRKGRKRNGNINQLKLTKRRILKATLSLKPSFMNRISFHLNN
jgi:hypothetical protein